MKARSFRLFLVLFSLGLFGCDHATKLAAEQALVGKGAVTLVPRVLDLRLTHNDDVAFSLIGRFDVSTHPWVLVAFASVTVALVAALWWRQRATATLVQHFAFAAVVAGALGNLVDRAFRGYVVDFIHVHAWPVFNVADIAVVCGGVALALAGLRGGGGRERPAPEPG